MVDSGGPSIGAGLPAAINTDDCGNSKRQSDGGAAVMNVDRLFGAPLGLDNRFERVVGIEQLVAAEEVECVLRDGSRIRPARLRLLGRQPIFRRALLRV